MQHGVPAEGATLVLGVELTVAAGRLRAIISEIGATPLDPVPDLEGPKPAFPDETALPADYDESGRSLSITRALVSTVSVERQGDTNVWACPATPPRTDPVAPPSAAGRPSRVLRRCAACRDSLDRRTDGLPYGSAGRPRNAAMSA